LCREFALEICLISIFNDIIELLSQHLKTKLIWQYGGLASGLTLQMGKIATVGLAPAIFGSLMNVTGSVLANFWRGKPVENDK
jgi:hypothetical protein